MSVAVEAYQCTFMEDATNVLLARVTAIEGTGTQVTGDQGKPIKQADVSTITAKVLDLGYNPHNSDGTEITPAPTVTISTSIYDTLQTTGWDLGKDATGYNFRYDLAATYIATGGKYYIVEFMVTLTGGSKGPLRWKGPAEALFMS